MEAEILNIATEKINELEGIECKILAEDMVGNGKFFDAEIAIYHGNLENRYFAEIKRKILPNHVPRILEQTENVEPLIIIADYITPKAKELLRINNVPVSYTHLTLPTICSV